MELTLFEARAGGGPVPPSPSRASNPFRVASLRRRIASAFGRSAAPRRARAARDPTRVGSRGLSSSLAAQRRGGGPPASGPRPLSAWPCGRSEDAADTEGGARRLRACAPSALRGDQGLATPAATRPRAQPSCQAALRAAEGRGRHGAARRVPPGRAPRPRTRPAARDAGFAGRGATPRATVATTGTAPTTTTRTPRERRLRKESSSSSPSTWQTFLAQEASAADVLCLGAAAGRGRSATRHERRRVDLFSLSSSAGPAARPKAATPGQIPALSGGRSLRRRPASALARGARRGCAAPLARRVTGPYLALGPDPRPGTRSWMPARARAFSARARALRPRRCRRIFRSAARPAARSGSEGGGTRRGAGLAAQAKPERLYFSPAWPNAHSATGREAMRVSAGGPGRDPRARASLAPSRSSAPRPRAAGGRPPGLLPRRPRLGPGSAPPPTAATNQSLSLMFKPLYVVPRGT